MPGALQGGVAGVINSQLYVAGGEAPGYTTTNTLYRYDPPSNNWTDMTSTPQPCTDGAAGVINSKLYVTCGYEGSGENKELDVTIL